MSAVMNPSLGSPPRFHSDSLVSLEIASPLSLNLVATFSWKALLAKPRIPWCIEALFSSKYALQTKSVLQVQINIEFQNDIEWTWKEVSKNKTKESWNPNFWVWNSFSVWHVFLKRYCLSQETSVQRNFAPPKIFFLHFRKIQNVIELLRTSATSKRCHR